MAEWLDYAPDGYEYDSGASGCCCEYPYGYDNASCHMPVSYVYTGRLQKCINFICKDHHDQYLWEKKMGEEWTRHTGGGEWKSPELDKLKKDNALKGVTQTLTKEQQAQIEAELAKMLKGGSGSGSGDNEWVAFDPSNGPAMCEFTPSETPSFFRPSSGDWCGNRAEWQRNQNFADFKHNKNSRPFFLCDQHMIIWENKSYVVNVVPTLKYREVYSASHHKYLSHVAFTDKNKSECGLVYMSGKQKEIPTVDSRHMLCGSCTRVLKSKGMIV